MRVLGFNENVFNLAGIMTHEVTVSTTLIRNAGCRAVYRVGRNKETMTLKTTYQVRRKISSSPLLHNVFGGLTLGDHNRYVNRKTPGEERL